MEKMSFFDPAHLLNFLPAHLNVGFILTDQNDVITHTDAFVRSICGSICRPVCRFDEDRIENLKFFDLPAPQFKFMNHVYKSGRSSMRPQHFEGLPLENMDGDTRYVSGLMLPFAENDQFSGMLCAIRDITEQKEMEQKLVLVEEDLENTIKRKTRSLIEANQQLEKEALSRRIKEKELLEIYQRYKNLHENVGEGICRLTPDGMFIEANDVMAAMLGYANPEELRTKVSRFGDQHFVEKEQWEYMAQRLFKDKTIYRLEVPLISRGKHIWTEMTAMLITTRWGQHCFDAIVSNITARKQREEELQHKATIDSLTQIPNRTLCMDRLEQNLKKARRFKDAFAVFFLDMDGFKAVNDTYGHQAGDEVLKLTARRILKQIRESDTLARLGGDEFCLILNSLKKPESAEKLARSIIETVNQPFDMPDGQQTVGVSIGIYIYDHSDLTPAEIIQKADTAMYQAKNQGGNTWVLHG